jgi:parallel beta-helix repeat protein
MLLAILIHRMPRLLACACYLCAFSGTAHAATYYVSPNGSDAASGTAIENPMQTIQKAVQRAAPGDTVMLRAGTYREQIEVAKGGSQQRPLTISAYKAELPVIKGSDVVTGWEPHEGAIWKKAGWGVNSQQVFVDFDEKQPVKPLQQIGMPSRFYKAFEYPKPVGRGLADMQPGSFFYDPAASTLYVWLFDGSDPNKHQMEVSTRKSLIRITAPYVNLHGLMFRHSNVSAFSQQGAAVELGAYSVMEACDVQWTDFAGVIMGYKQPGAQVIDSNISNNGNSGLNGPASYGFRVSGVTLNGNNYRGFNPLWHAGGLKATTQAHGIVERSEVAFNKGSGIWFDYANSGEAIVIRNNYIHDNGPVDSAIFFEVSKNGHIYNNVLANNARRGIYLSGSDDTRVYNNTLFGTRDYAGIELGGLPRAGATLTNNMVYNNIISHGSTRYDLIILPPNGASIAGNQSDYNNIYRPNEPIRLTSGNSYTDLAGWRSATRLDARSISADPRFVAANPANPAGTPGKADDLAVQPGSPVLGAGKREEKKAGDADEAASTASIGAFIGSPAQHRRAPPGK